MKRVFAGVLMLSLFCVASAQSTTQAASTMDKFRVPEVSLSRLCMKYKEVYPAAKIDVYVLGYPLFITHGLVTGALETQGLKGAGTANGNPADRLEGFYSASFTGAGGSTLVLYDAGDRYKTEVCIVRP